MQLSTVEKHARPGTMSRFRIDELSGVGNPAQAGAKVCFIKRDDGAGETDPVIKRTFTAADRERLAASGAAMEDGSYPIETKDDLRNAVAGFGRAKDPPKAKAHIVARARALSATDELPEAWNVDGDGDDDTEADRTAKAMIANGEAIMKASRRAPSRPDLALGEKVDWAATAAAHAQSFDKMARDLQRASPGLSYAKAYVAALEANPEAARRAMQG